MIDPHFITENFDLFLEKMIERGAIKTKNYRQDTHYSDNYDVYYALDNINNTIKILKKLNGELADLNNKRKLLAKAFNEAGGSESVLEVIKDQVSKNKILVKNVKEKIKKAEISIKACELFPNIAADDVPVGDEKANKLIKTVGQPNGIAAALDHIELGKRTNGIDFETAVLITGSSGFSVLKGDVSRLERAIYNFMLDSHNKNNFIEHSVPYVASGNSFTGTGQLPKFKYDIFGVSSDFDDVSAYGGAEILYGLIPTGEVSLTNTVKGMLLKEEQLPIRMVTLTPCFRTEKGNHSSTRGLIRQHQFNKVELVSIATPEKSEEEHEYMLSCAEQILIDLELPYQVMLLASKDMGFSAQKTYDIEVWLPSKMGYTEISSVSNCGEFQARRMDTRFKAKKDNRFVHTLNGSGLAVGRTLVAIMENYQNPDGSITIPTKLVPYMGGQTKIEIIQK